MFLVTNRCPDIHAEVSTPRKSKTQEEQRSTDRDVDENSCDELLDSDDDDNVDYQDANEEDTENKFWTDIPEDVFDHDILSAQPLPHPEEKKSKLHFIHSLLQAITSDNGLAWLLKFRFQYFRELNLHVPNSIIEELIAIFQTSLYLIRKYLKLDRDDLKYVVCAKCYKCYEYRECLEKVNGKYVGRHCLNKLYSRGKAHLCNSRLVKKVILKDNVVKFYPLYYCFSSIINSLERLIKKPGFPDKCEQWRSDAANQNGLLTDVYHGKLWRDFGKFKTKDFLDVPRNYSLTLNFDYFQPMKHQKDYSVGVLYLVVQNLPHSERFKWENVIVVGIIPSMDCEPKCLNEFFRPAVAELNVLCKGLCLTSSLSRVSLVFHHALLSTSCDIPASRKLCGSKGHSTALGCSKCLKNFSGSFGEKQDYSGFDRENWVSRTDSDHRRN